MPPSSYEPVIASPGAQCPFCRVITLLIDSEDGLVERPGTAACEHFSAAKRKDGLVFLKFLKQ